MSLIKETEIYLSNILSDLGYDEEVDLVSSSMPNLGQFQINVAMKLAKKFPVWKSLFASGGDFDWDKTQAYLSDLSALKNYSYGGIRLNETVADKDALADQIIEYLKPIKIEGEDKNLFEWIVRTNTFYHGPYLNKYPEIIYQMDERWGGEWELGQKVFALEGIDGELQSCLQTT